MITCIAIAGFIETLLLAWVLDQWFELRKQLAEAQRQEARVLALMPRDEERGGDG